MVLFKTLKTLFIFFLFVKVFFFLPLSTSAQVVLNEILPNPSSADDATEFIELYNNSDQIIDISGWKLKDKAGKIFTIENIEIHAKDFMTFHKSQTGISLNNDTEEIFLLGPTDELKDSIFYNSTKTDIPLGRYPDGTGGIIELTTFSPGDINSPPSPTSTITSTPSPTQKATPTEKPSSTPKPTNTPKPTSTPRATSTEKPSQSSSEEYPTSSETQKNIIVKNSTQSSQNVPTAILGTSTKNKEGDKDILVKSEKKYKDNSIDFIAIGLIAIGSICALSCGILAFRSFRKKDDEIHL